MDSQHFCANILTTGFDYHADVILWFKASSQMRYLIEIMEDIYSSWSQKHSGVGRCEGHDSPLFHLRMLLTRIRNPQDRPKYFTCIDVDSQKHLVMPLETITVSSSTRHAFYVLVPIQMRESRRCFQALPETARL